MPDLTTTPGCGSGLAFERLLCGDLSAPQLQQMLSHLEACPRCRTRHEELRDEREAFLAEHPSFEALERSVARDRRASRFRPGALPALAAAAAAAIALLVVGIPGRAPGPAMPGPESTAEATRTKGTSSVGFFVMRDARVEPGVSGGVVHPGDRLRFTYSTERPRYLALLNRDARRAMVYYPRGPQAAPAPAGRSVALDFAIELDGVLGSERVYALFCDAPVTLEPLRAALERDDTLLPPPGCSVDRIDLTKERGP